MLADEAGRHANFRLLRSTPATDILRDRGRVVGVRATGKEGDIEIGAALTVAADGRGSVIRERLGLRPREFGAPMDVLWFRLPREPGDGEGLGLRVGGGQLALCIDRGDYWQVAWVIRKGGYGAVVAEGLPEFRRRVASLVPFLAGRVDGMSTWDDIKVLTVAVNRLDRWYAPGVLLIGDAAHAMSPIGGVGINLAVQDAAAAARLLVPALRSGGVSTSDLARVQRRRQLPTAVTQRVQRLVQRRFLGPLLASASASGLAEPVSAPRVLHLLRRFPALQGIPARLVGLGLRPEPPTTSRRSRA
jgi:2-polyprenyl-6-methoxyphenol hydroxylase-like FAD-dependent oxidoreductase